MERYKCKLCFKRFSNGRALGGHMRSHVMMMDLTQEPPRSDQHTDSASSPSLSSLFEQQKENTHHGNNDYQRGYVLRENPKKSIRLADPEFSFKKNMSSSAFVQDIESETESSKNDPTRRRSIRTRNSNAFSSNHQKVTRKKMKLGALCKNSESWVQLEPVNSSISGVTTEEDVAYCLMMLSRDKWKTNKQKQPEEEEEEEEEEEVDDDVEDDADDDVEEEEDLEEFEICRRSSARGKYKCETCKKVFKSYQALGGHRASHMKIKPSTYPPKPMSSHELENVSDSKIQEYECPYCFRVFSSGQALGGHKRSHGPGGGLNNNIAVPETRVKKIMEIAMIDLNLPAPIDNDDDNGGEFEFSIVSNSANR